MIARHLLFASTLLANLIFTLPLKAEEYQFASIRGLYEQQVGQIVLPKIYQKLGISITIKPMPGQRAMLETASGRTDGEIMRIWSYGIEHPDSLRIPTPYYQLETMAFYKAGSSVDIKSAKDLANYSLLKVRGVKHTNNITVGLDRVYDYDDTENMLKALNKVRNNVALTHTSDGLFAIRKYHIKEIEHLDQPLSVLPLYHYVHKKNAHLIAAVDRVIKEMKHSGELKSLIEAAEKQVYEMHGLSIK
jgi:polar amino acid transport system substrate-binding protein